MILLQILKITGFILAGLLGLILLLILTVCFIPVRYAIRGSGENADLEGSVSVAWLAGLAKAVVAYKDKKLRYQVKIAGWSLMKGVLGEDETQALRKVLQEEEILADRKQYDKISKELQKAEEKAEKAEALKEEKRKEKEQEKEERKLEKEAGKEKQKEERKAKSLRDQVRERLHKAKELYEKFQTVKKIWEARATRRALKHLKTEIFNILNHLKPKKIAGSIGFGLEDPANTALLYGNIAPSAEAVSKGKLILTPEFHQQGIRMDLLIKGRIFIGYMVLSIARLYFDRDIQRVVKVIRRYFNG